MAQRKKELIKDDRYSEDLKLAEQGDNNLSSENTGKIIEEYQNKIRELEIQVDYHRKNNLCMQKNKERLLSENNLLVDQKEQILDKMHRIANTRPYRFAYFLRRSSTEFIKGDISQKKSYLKWVFYKIIRKDVEEKHKYNPLFEIE